MNYKSIKYWKWIFIIKFILIIGSSKTLFSQRTINIVKELKLEGNYNDIQIDQHGYIYQINKDNLIKLDQDGNSLFSYSNKLLGEIDQIDISNPLRPLLFYKDQGVIAVLDNTLSLQENTIDLNELGLYQANCIANSNFDNGIWLYDIDRNEIIKIDPFSSITYRSGNLTVLFSELNSPVFQLVEKNKHVYALTKSLILVFDQFGSLLKKIPIKTSNGFLLDNENLIGYDGINLVFYESVNFSYDTIPLLNVKYDYIRGGPGKIIGINNNAPSICFLKIKE